MVNNGLNISLSQFKRMKRIDRDEVMYQNLVHIRKAQGDSKFHRKFVYMWLFVLSSVLGLRRFLPI
ncbi:hypothetical protein LCGC14_2358990 [marine sediment metagenome]|uniref:Uncharacterized protein n=1 Tax=marine sediment metagenome TaxID=412755 RepID=A0A0F9C7C6_9ZZZZ